MSLDSPPLTPTSDQAREWLTDELAKAVYRDDRTPLQRLIDWISDLLNSLPRGAGGLPGWSLWVAVGVVAAIILLTLTRSLRMERRLRRSDAGDGVLGSERLTSDQYRARALAALERGDAVAATLDAYRAVVAGATERTLLDDLPGRTAHEAAVALRPVFPSYAAPLASAADLFDAVRYGKRSAEADQARWLLGLEEQVRRATPVLPELAGAPS